MRRMGGLLGPLAVAGATLAVFFGGKSLLFGTPDGYVVRAEFKDSGGLRKNSAVKIGGVPGGKVTDIVLTPRDTALVTMHLDDNAAPVGRDAVARSRPVNLLGEKYVDLTTRDARHPMPSGATIPTRRTGAPVELDDVLNALSPDVRGRVRILINESGIALAGRGADFNSLLGGLPPALDELRRMVSDLGADTDRMHRLIARSHRVVRAVDAHHDDLGRLVANAASVLDTTARRRTQLGATIRDAPATLRRLRTAVAQLGASTGELAPGAAQLRRTARPLEAVLRRAPAFATDAAGALATARATAPTLTKLGREGRPTVARLRPVADELTTFAGQLDPVSKTLDRSIGDALGFIHGYARAEQQRDGLGHQLRLREIIGKDALDAIIDRYVKAPAASRRGPPSHRPPVHHRRPEGLDALPLLSRKPSPAAPAAQPSPSPAVSIPGIRNVVDQNVRTTKGVLKGLLRP